MIASLVDRLNLNGDIRTIISRNYPKNYPNNEYTMWLLQAPEGYEIKLRVVVFKTEDNDYLYIGLGASQFSYDPEKWKILSGDAVHKTEFTTFNQSMTVIFTSDGVSTKKGFIIECSASTTLGKTVGVTEMTKEHEKG